MSETTIEWTATAGPDGTTHPGFTFNPWEGCSKVHAGCANCYAETRANRFGTAKWGPNGTRRVTSSANWIKPLAWNRKAKELGVRLKVFCASLADVFEDWGGPMSVSIKQVLHNLFWFEGFHKPFPATANLGGLRPVTMNDVRSDLFSLIDGTPHLDWLLLTKRPENIRRMWPLPPKDPWPDCLAWDFASVAEFRSNVWLLTSVSDQASADKQIPELLKCRDLSPVIGLSCEPLLGAIHLRNWLPYAGHPDDYRPTTHNASGIDWSIVGGESGPNARPMHPDWARSLRDQCAAAGVPFFFKQWGEWAPGMSEHEYPERRPLACMKPTGEMSWWSGNADTTHNYSRNYEMTDVGIERVGKKAAGRLLDGVEHNGMPTALQTTPTPGETPETKEGA